ncbi:MAG: DUF5060 domain-containing protein [Lentisphaeria bacterium]
MALGVLLGLGALAPAGAAAGEAVAGRVAIAGAALARLQPLSAQVAVRQGAGGREQLAVAGAFPGTFGVMGRLPAAGILAGPAAAALFLPADAPADLRVAWVMKDKDGLWFQAAASAPPERGRWTRVEFDLAPGGGQVQQGGHGAVWNDYYARHMLEVGVTFFSAAAWHGEIGVESLVAAAPPAAPAGPLLLHGFEWKTPAPFLTHRPLELAFELAGFTGNPFDPDEVTVDAEITGPDGQSFRRPAFFSQDYERRQDAAQREVLSPRGRAGWRLRFTPLQAGAYHWRLLVRAGDRRVETRPAVVKVAAGQPGGFVAVSPRDPRFFETADGAFFYPIGEHLHTPYDLRSVQCLKLPMATDRGTYDYDHYFAKFEECGANAILMWMSSWWTGIEWTAEWPGFFGLTDFNLANAWRLDYVLELAARRGVQIVLVLENHGKLSAHADPEWRYNPLNRRLGGPCQRPEDFFTTEAAFKLFTKRLRYCLARWGEHPHMMGWELVSELDLVGSNRSFRWDPATRDWTRRAGAWLAANDRLHRPVTMQYCHSVKNVDMELARMPEISFMVSNAYKDGGLGSIVPVFLRSYRALEPLQKPQFIAEFGGNYDGTTHEQLEADLHCGLWATAMTPAGGSPFFWWFYFVDHKNLYPEFRALANFMRGEDPRGVEWRYREWPVRKGEDSTWRVRALVLQGADQGRAWIYDVDAPHSLARAQEAGEHHQVSLELSGLRDGTYDVEFWDTGTGRPTGRTEARTAAGGGLAIGLPPFTVDLAIKFRRRP